MRTGMQTLLPTACAALSLAACGPRDSITPVSSGDAKVNVAIAEAQHTLPVFWAKLDSGDASVKAPMVKVRLPTPDGGFEHIWVDVESHSADAVRGRVNNDPDDLPKLHFGDEITARVTDVTDWAYTRNGKTYGGYTTRALLDRASAEDRRQITNSLSPTPLELGDH